ncbi:MAG TPA: DUF4214 domain-containing protein [Burkholderiaceae bacterium]
MGIRFSRFTAPAVLVAATVLAACGAGGSDTAARTQMAQPRIKQVGTQKSDYATVVQQLYIAYFGRPADPNGLGNFENQLLLLGAPTDVGGLADAYKTNTAIASLIDSFGLSTESKNLYGSTTTAQFVASIFGNVLGRQPATAGSTFWVNAIDSGATSRGDAALSIMAGAFANTSNPTQAQADVQLIDNRVSVAANFTGEVSSLNAVSSYTGSAAAQSARQMLAQVTSTTTASTQQIITVIQGLIGSALQAYAGNYCGTISGAFSGTVDLTLSSNGNSTFAVTGTVFVGGQSIPIQGTTQPPTLNVELMCTTGVCGTATATVTTSAIAGTYSITNVGSGNISLSHSCP